MDYSKDSKIEIPPSIADVKLEPFDKTQDFDRLKSENNVEMKIELLQDIKTEPPTEGYDQAISKLIEEDILKNDVDNTEIKIEELYIKSECVGNEPSAFDEVQDSCRIIQGEHNLYLYI